MIESNAMMYDLENKELDKIYVRSSDKGSVLHIMFKVRNSHGYDQMGLHVQFNAIKESVNGVILNG